MHTPVLVPARLLNEYLYPMRPPSSIPSRAWAGTTTSDRLSPTQDGLARSLPCEAGGDQP